MKYVYWRMTDNCNLTCGHCCYSCGPGKDTVSLDDAKKIVEHFPRNLRLLTLSGGEIFTQTPTLFSILSDVQSKEFPKLQVVLQTNGFWARDADAVYDTLKQVHDLGVTQINFSGNDEYHQEQGLDTYGLLVRKNSPLRLGANRLEQELLIQESRQRPRSLIKTLLKYFGARDHITINVDGATGIAPFGRACNLPQSCLAQESCCEAKGMIKKGQEDLTIDPHGQVYLCCYGMPYAIGSAIDSPLEEIATRARSDPILEELHKHGLTGVAKRFKIDSDKDYESNPCGACREIFKKIDKSKKAD